METVSGPAMTYVANALWWAVLVAAAAWLCDRTMRRATAGRRYALWVGAMMACMLGPLWSLKTAREVFGEPVILREVPPEGEPASAAFAPSRDLTVVPTVQGVLAGLYALFLVIRFAGFLRDARVARNVRKRAYRTAGCEAWRPVVEDCARSLGVPTVPPVLCSATAAGPMTVGFRRPVIILPASLVESASPELLTSVIGHEMAHIRRADFAWNIVLELFSLPLSFHPAVSFLKRRIRDTRELACDELVTAKLVDPIPYAEAILLVARSLSRRNEPGYALGVLDGNILAERIATLLKPRHPLTAAGAMAALGLSLTVVLLCAMAASALALGVRTETAGAELSGTVFDPSSAVIPEARVELAPAGSEEWQVAGTGQAGEFRFANLATGEYDLRVLKQGFMRYRARISLRDSARIRPALQIGRIRETLTVIGN